MGCAIGTVKILLFVFNFIFALCGLGILTVGVLIHLQLGNIADHVDTSTTFPAVTLIIVGSIIFVISFFGCCGAIRSNHCMIVTFASLLIIILLIQVAVAVYAFLSIKNINENEVKNQYRKLFDNSAVDVRQREIVDAIQITFHCCGVNSADDYLRGNEFNQTIPLSCCSNVKEGDVCQRSEAYNIGCASQIKTALNTAGIVLGGVAVAIAGVELIGIIFALCLANSVRNAERRGYRV